VLGYLVPPDPADPTSVFCYEKDGTFTITTVACCCNEDARHRSDRGGH